MKAFAIHRYARPLVAVDTSEPVVGRTDVLVEMRAASINQLDSMIAAGKFKSLLPYEFPLVLGHDLAGVVIEVGADAKRFEVGDRVFGRVRDGRIGTFAERIAVAEEDLALMPESVSMREAASLPLVALTAWQALVEIGNVRPGQKVMIHAGAGGVGSIAIQLAKHLGATVATTVSEPKMQLVRDLGADVVIDYRRQRFEEHLIEYDLVLDGISTRNVSRSLRVLRPGGRVVGIAGPPTPAFARRIGANALMRAFVRIASSKVRQEAAKRGVVYDFLWMRPSGEQLTALAALVDAGFIQPVVAETFPFDETPSALAALSAGKRAGKVVVYRP